MTLAARVQVIRPAFRLDVELAVSAGEVVAVLGPNGAGKSTLLQSLAGLVPLDRGRVRLDGTVLEDPTARIRVPPERRPVGVVFQDYLLFPHLSAVDNVAFGPRCRGVDRATAHATALSWLSRMGLAEFADVRPGRLSGGQAQRVALARALAVHPRLLLLDEPLSALDVHTRGTVRGDLHRQLREHDGATLVVTHDPLEAVMLADRLVVLEQGRIVQEGSAAEVAQRPRTDYVARLVGVNLYRGTARGHELTVSGGGTLVIADAAEGTVFAAVRPAAVALHGRQPEGSPRNVWRGVVATAEPYGDHLRVRVDGTPPVVADVTAAAAADLDLVPGAPMWVSVKAAEVSVYPG